MIEHMSRRRMLRAMGAWGMAMAVGGPLVGCKGAQTQPQSTATSVPSEAVASPSSTPPPSTPPPPTAAPASAEATPLPPTAAPAAPTAAPASPSSTAPAQPTVASAPTTAPTAAAATSQIDAAKLEQQACAQCHSLNRVRSMRADQARWTQIIERMRGHGAQLTDEEAEALAAYLAEVQGN